MKNRIVKTLRIVSFIAIVAILSLPSIPVIAVPAEVTVIGAPLHINIETMADGTGTKINDVELAPGEYVAAYAIKRDSYNCFLGNVAVTWALTHKTGNVIDSDLVPRPDGKSAKFTANATGSAKIHILSEGESINTIDSGIISVIAPIASGGGLGASSSGGGGTDDKRFTNISASATEDGVLWEDVTALSTDTKLELLIPEGTKAVNANGYPLHSITIVNINDQNTPPTGFSFVGRRFDLLPEGTTFDPPVNFTVHYEDSEIPEGVSEEDLRIHYWNKDLQIWEAIECTVDQETNTITANLSHFSEYAVLAGNEQASFSSSPLEITSTPDETDTVTITTIITNQGDLTGTTSLTLYIDEEATQTKMATLAGGKSAEISFTFTSAPGIHIARIGDHQTEFTIDKTSVELEKPLSPANITVSSIGVSSQQVTPDETVTVMTTLVNSGEQDGVYTVVLKLNDEEERHSEIAVPALSEKKVSFAVLREKIGTYEVECGGRLCQFSVIAPVAVTEPTNEDSNPSTADKKASNQWYVVGVAIGGVMIIGLTTILIIRRKNKWLD